MKRWTWLCTVLLMAGAVWAQETNPPATNGEQPLTPMAQTPVYKVQVVARTTKAVNYRHHSGGTDIAFRGTELMQESKGKARVESRTGRIEIDAEFEHLRKARMFGPEYLTYVLWAITPEGRAVNLGEVTPDDDGKSALKVSTDLQAFGLIVTAEPYFAVTRPSNEVVLENEIKTGTKGWEMPIDARFDLLERGSYSANLNAQQLPSITADPKMPVDLLEAMNAVAIARAAQADQYAPAPLQKAEDFLARAQDYYQRKQGSKAIGTVARGAVQSAEDARVLAIRTREQREQEAERQAMQQRTEQAQTQAEEEARQRQQADEDRRQAEQARADAEQARQQAEAAKAAADAQRQAAEAQARQAEQDKEETRQRLMQQLNQVLQTRESARGLIVNMPDVLFDTGKYTLKPGARERLAKVAGILQTYPGLTVQVEGHTDSVGSDEYNQQLSENRANSVREYLVTQGVPPTSITAQGFGKTQPVASNDTAAGRQMNRRVDMVVSGATISGSGQATGTAPVPATGPQQPQTMPMNSTPMQPAQVPPTQPQPSQDNNIPHR
jgi:outer membrane protein OmpA-like peptidoglycan-associated protein